MIQLLPFGLLAFPFVFQIIYGRKAIGGGVTLSFRTICGISIVLQLLLSTLSFFIEMYILERDKITCGIPLAGIVMLAMIFSFLLVVTLIIQYFIKKSYAN
jgi:hypothetical protein